MKRSKQNRSQNLEKDSPDGYAAYINDGAEELPDVLVHELAEWNTAVELDGSPRSELEGKLTESKSVS
jgi:hypothetical protein